MAKKKPTQIVSLGKATTRKETGKKATGKSRTKGRMSNTFKLHAKLDEYLARLGLTHERLPGYLIVEFDLTGGEYDKLTIAEKVDLLKRRLPDASPMTDSPKRIAAPRRLTHEAITRALVEYLTANGRQCDSKGRAFKKKSLHIQALAAALNDSRFASYRQEFNLKTEEGKNEAAKWVREKVRYFKKTRKP